MGNADSRWDAVRRRADRERLQAVGELRTRSDFWPQFEYFLERLLESPSDTKARIGRPLIALLCIQSPLEIFHALGVMPYRVFSASHAHGLAAAPMLPALACPLLRSTLGALGAGGKGDDISGWVLPATCDWVVKFPEMAVLAGVGEPENVHWLELPHLKDSPESQARWGDEVRRIVAHLERLTGRTLSAAALSGSMDAYQNAWRMFSRLIDARRFGTVPAVWFTVIANAFYRDTPELWTSAVEAALPFFDKVAAGGKRVFLAGSPVFFPNYKLPLLVEDAGLTVTADDLCSSERIFPGAAHYRDPSLPGLLNALAERYHQGCLCPTFADNQRRPATIIGQREYFDGVVFQVLKGCHPYDLESFTLEKTLKERGIRFLRLETDYAAEDRQNILTRLEAFRASLQ